MNPSRIYCKDSPVLDDLFGFAADDVRAEVKRGSKLPCAKCKRRGATVGCEVVTCTKCYHYPCAVEDVARTLADNRTGEYLLFCFKHSKSQQRQNSDSQDERVLMPSGSATPSTCSSERRSLPADMRADVSSKKRKLLSDSSSSGDEEPAPLFAPAKDSNGEQSFNLKPRDQAPEVEEEKEQGCDLDAAAFWRCCNTAGCTDAILGNFLADMEDVSLRIRQERASRQDLDLALRVMMSSGKLAQLLRKEQKELEQKETVAQKSLAAMREAISLLSARRASGDFAASKVSAESGE